MFSIPLHVPTALLVGAFTLVSPVASGATPNPSKPAARTIDVELVETTAKGTSRASFAVPIGGEIDAWVREGDDPRFCRVRADHAHEVGAYVIELSCARNISAPHNLHVKARRVLAASKPVSIGLVERPDGRTIDVRAKLR